MIGLCVGLAAALLGADRSICGTHAAALRRGPGRAERRSPPGLDRPALGDHLARGSRRSRSSRPSLALGIDLGSPLQMLAAAWTTQAAVGVAVALPSAPGFFGLYHFACKVALLRFGVAPETAVAAGDPDPRGVLAHPHRPGPRGPAAAPHLAGRDRCSRGGGRRAPRPVKLASRAADNLSGFSTVSRVRKHACKGPSEPAVLVEARRPVCEAAGGAFCDREARRSGERADRGAPRQGEPPHRGAAAQGARGGAHQGRAPRRADHRARLPGRERAHRLRRQAVRRSLDQPRRVRDRARR